MTSFPLEIRDDQPVIPADMTAPAPTPEHESVALWPVIPPSGAVVPSAAWLSWQATAKRGLDIVAAIVGLIVLAPLMALIALAIRYDSPGPVIFRQIRCGKDGRHFTFYKFRGMTADAEARRHEVAHLNEIVDGPTYKSRMDPRVTRVGKFIRSTSLDELPQLWNVLRGEMSLVGPRPPIPSEVAQYEPWQCDRLAAVGGITGLWQVSGRSDLGFDEMVQLDVRYIEQWSIWLDLRILARTAAAVLSTKGAY